MVPNSGKFKKNLITGLNSSLGGVNTLSGLSQGNSKTKKKKNSFAL
jgi:hypothetical protein